MTTTTLLSPLVWRSTLALAVVLTASACTSTLPRCPSDTEMRADMLYGKWQVQLAGEASSYTLSLGPHPEHTGSLKGELLQEKDRRAVVADLDNGEFTMEESQDGVRIAATWLGQPTPGHCGRLIQGVRFEKDQTGQSFQLRAQP